jgi:hypothetical protein
MTWQWILMLIPVALIVFMMQGIKQAIEKEAREGSFRGIKFEDLKLSTDGSEPAPCNKVILNGETIWERGK